MEGRIRKGGLNATQLQWIAVIGMIVDHIAWVFLPLENPISLTMHFFGRLTFPIMGYFIAQGYSYSRNVPKYIGRLFLLALISVVPFYLMASPLFGPIPQNTVFTLALGLVALYLAGKVNNRFIKALIVTVVALLSVFFDSGVSGVLMIYFMGVAKNKKVAVIGGTLVSIACDNMLTFINGFLSNMPYQYAWSDLIFALGVLGAIPLLLCYNGEKGRKSKYLFYVIYPLHLLIIWAVSILIR